MSFIRLAARSARIAHLPVAIAATILAGACTRDSGAGGGASGIPAGASAVATVAATAMAATTAPADTDGFGAPLPVDATHARRIVSLNPAATELLFAIGADDRLVGRSSWDEFPAEASRVPKLGDGIRPNVEAVLAVRPTLVILYATPDNRAAADAFRRAGVRVMALRVDHIAEFMALTSQLGVATGRTDRAAAVRDSVARTLERVRALVASQPRRTVVWPAWLSPVMVIGGGSYLDELIEIAGARNVFHDDPSPSPAVSIEEIARRDPEFVVASAGSLAKLRADAGWKSVAAVRAGRFLVDDPALSGRPSVTLGMAATALARALHPALADSLR